MTRNIQLEFFPELELHAPQVGSNTEHTKIMMLPSKTSLRVYTQARYIKWQFSRGPLKNSKFLGPNVRIVLIKKYTNLNGYRMGKRKPMQIFPVLVFQKKLLLEGKVLVRGVLKDLIREHLVVNE